jgi:hypothetical protein
MGIRNRWQPVLGRDAVPSLVDAAGYFPESEDAFKAGRPVLAEVERELRAQIQRAQQAGLKLDYLDCHMNIAFSTPELRAVLEKLAKEFRLGISTGYGENERTLWEVPPRLKKTRLLAWFKALEPERVNLFVFHIGRNNDEMKALYDMNNPEDPARIGQHRGAEYRALSSKAFKQALRDSKATVITYRDLAAPALNP